MKRWVYGDIFKCLDKIFGLVIYILTYGGTDEAGNYIVINTPMNRWGGCR